MDDHLEDDALHVLWEARDCVFDGFSELTYGCRRTLASRRLADALKMTLCSDNEEETH